MTDRKTVLVHIHVSQGDAATRAAGGSVHARVSSPGGTHTTVSTHAGSPKRGRSWAVAFHGQKYLVADAGATGLTITRDGAVVWTGQRSTKGGGYNTRTSTIPSEKLEGLLKLVGVGDERTPKVHAPPPHRALAATRQASAKVSTKPHSGAAPSSWGTRPITEAQAQALAQGREVRAEQIASQRAGGAPAASSKPKTPRSRKPKAASRRTPSATRPSTKPASKPARVAPASAKPHSAKPASATRPASTKAAAPAKRKPGRPPKQAAAPTSKKSDQAPATRRSVRNPAVDDSAVLAEVKKKVQRDDPKNASKLYTALQRIWFAGGREATLTWMASQNIATVVEAFSDWVDKNPAAARALLKKAPRSQRAAAA